MAQRDFRNTMGFLDLMAREGYEQGQQQKQNQIEAERRQAEYAGTGMLLKGVGQEIERQRGGRVKKAGAEGMGAALDETGVPQETGDVEMDAAGLEGYNKTRLGLQANKATLARLAATRDHNAVLEELARARLGQGEDRINNLQAWREHQASENDQNQAFKEETRLDNLLKFLAGENSYSGQTRDPNAMGALRSRLGGGAAPTGGGAPQSGGSPYSDPNMAPDTGVTEGDWYTLSKAERKEISEQLAATQKSRQGVGRARKAINENPASDFGRRQGGLGDKFGWLGKWGTNDIDSIRGVWDGDAQKRTERREMTQGTVDEIINEINRVMNSSRATDKDRENVARALGVVNQKAIYSTSQDQWNRILDLRDKVLENDERILVEENRTGRRRAQRPDPNVERITAGYDFGDQTPAPQAQQSQDPGEAAYVKLREQGLNHEQAMAELRKAPPF